MTTVQDQSNPLLSIEGLEISLATPSGARPFAVHGVDLTIGRGEIVGLAGESGSGKTITALSLLKLLPSGARASGRILFEGRELLSLDEKAITRIRGRDISMVFQDPMTSLHPMLSIERQMTEHLRYHRGMGAGAARKRAIELLDMVRIPNASQAIRRFPHQFSGGMRQRIAIASALTCGPKLLIADEPTTALDVTVQAGILRLLERLRSELDLSVLLITHDLGVMSALTDRVSVMYAGRIVEQGDRQLVLGRPRHPYTKGLLDALPQVEDDAVALTAVEGAPPPITAIPPGCAFHPRCVWAEDRCSKKIPMLSGVGEGQAAACLVDPFAEAAS